MDYYVEDTIDLLKNVKNNPYGIKNRYHALERAQKRSIITLIKKDINKRRHYAY